MTENGIKTILVVDDDPLITGTLQTLIKIMLKHHVISFNNPLEALSSDVMLHSNVDMVISDFLMPGLNGIEFLKKVKEIKPDAISILLTGYADKENAIKSINELGLYYYMEKPWDNNLLAKIVENGLDKKDLTLQLKKKVRELEAKNHEIEGLNSILKGQFSEAVNNNKFLENLVRERTQAVKDLLDNAGQGFLYFDDDLKIKREYSNECLRFFGDHLEGKKISELLYPEDLAKENLLAGAFRYILANPGDSTSELYLGLLPETIVLNGLKTELKYKMMQREDTQEGTNEKQTMLIILTDVTDKMNLVNSMEEERKFLKMVVKAVIYRNDIIENINDFKEFYDSIAQRKLSDINSISTFVMEVFRKIHNFKGIFAQYDMNKTTLKLHELESYLMEVVENRISVEIPEIQKIFWREKAESWIFEDIFKLNELLGEDFFSGKSILTVDSKRFSELEELVLRNIDERYKSEVINVFKCFRLTSLKKMLSAYPDYSYELAQRLHKSIYPFTIEGDDVFVDSNVVSDFVKSLVNVFRNMVDHGIEPSEKRINMEKDESGRISCKLFIDGRNLNIAISDDGGGIDISSIRRLAEEKGIFDKNLVIEDNELMKLIFRDSFSTNQRVNLNSGRGLGLASVREELKKIGGTWDVISEYEQWTTFTFSIPLDKIT